MWKYFYGIIFIISIMVKTIKLSDETHKKLGKLGTKDDTYEEIIIKLINKTS